MALGSNIKYQLQAVFEAAFDEKSAKQVEQMYDKMSKRVTESTREEFVSVFKEFGTTLNSALQKLNIKPIDIDKLIELPNAQMFSKLGSEFGTKFADGFKGAISGGGINTSIQDQIKQLEKQKLNYQKKQTKLPEKLKRYNYLYELPDLASEEEIRPFSIDDLKKMGKDFDEVALSIQTAFDNMEAEFDEMTRGTEEYYQALIKTREAASDLYRMGATINKHPDWFKDEFLASDYDGANLSDLTADFFDKSQDDLLAFIKEQDNLLSNIPTKLKEIDSQLDAIKKDNSEIINIEENSAGLKTLEEIEEAYKRILNAKGKIGKQGKNIENALTFDPASSKVGLQSMFDSYTKLLEDTPWEVEYQWLLKYVKLYESYLTSENKTHRNKTENPEFKELYDKLSPMAKNAKNMLESVVGFGETPVKVKVEVDNPIDTPEEVTDGKKEVKVPVKPIVNDVDDDLDSFLGDLLGNDGKEKQKILLYRRVEGEFDPNRISGRSTDALYNKENEPIIQQALESGFGGHGDGLYASVLSGARDLIRHGDGENSFIEFDASNYNMYINETLEEAELLSDFLLSLQKFVGDKTFLDTSKLPDIEDLNEEQLYKAAQLAIKNFDMSQEQFHLWLENARKEAEEVARLFANKEVPEDRHNFGTRFMKTLGYEGVLNDTEDEEYNGNYWGSVIYDPKPEDIKKGLRVFEDKEAFSNYLNKIQVEVEPEVINPIDEPEEITGGKSKVKVPVKPETDDDWMSSLLNLEKYKTDNQGDESFDAGTGNASSAELEKLRAENENLKNRNEFLERDAASSEEAFREMRERAEEAEHQLTNMDLDQTKLDNMYQEVIDADNARIAAEEKARMLEEELARIKADSDGKKLVDKDVSDNTDELIALRTQLEDEQMMRRSTENALGEVLGEKYSAEKQAMEAREEAERLRKQLANVDTTPKQSGKQIDGVDVKLEASQLKKVQQAVEAVTTAVNQKSKSFYDEGKIVGQVVGKEVNTLSKLHTQVKEVNDTVLKLVGNLKNVKTAAKTDIKVKVENVEGNKNPSSKPKEKSISEETPKRNKSEMNRLEKDYEKLGRLWARLDEDNKSTQSPLIENLEESIKYQQESLGLTEKEIDALKEKMAIAEQAENRIIQGEKEQAAKDKEIADNMKFARSIKDLYEQYEKLGKLQAQADAGDLGKAEEARQLEKIIQQEVERLKLNEAQHAEVLKNLQLKQQEAKANKASILAEKEAEKDWKKRVKDAQKSAGVNRASSAINAGDSAVNNIIGVEDVNSDVEAKAQELASQISALTNLRNQIQKQGAEVSDDERKQLNEQINSVNKLTEEMKELLAIHQKYSGDNVEDVNADVSSFKNLGLDAYEQQLTRVAEASVNARLQNVKFNPETKELTATVKTGANAFTTYSFAVDRVDGKLKKLNQGTKKTETFMEGVTRKTKELAQYALGSISIYDVFNQVRQGVQYIREIDSALTELKKVTEATEQEYDKFLETASKTGARIGSTISDFTEATATFAKLGYDMNMASSMAESAIVYQNVGDGIESAEAAADSIISTMKGFGMQASESMAIVDRFNEVGNRFAVTSKGIGDALQRSASALSEGGNTLDESIGLITAANSVVQDTDKVGRQACRR